MDHDPHFPPAQDRLRLCPASAALGTSAGFQLSEAPPRPREFRDPLCPPVQGHFLFLPASAALKYSEGYNPSDSLPNPEESPFVSPLPFLQTPFEVHLTSPDTHTKHFKNRSILLTSVTRPELFNNASPRPSLGPIPATRERYSGTMPISCCVAPGDTCV